MAEFDFSFSGTTSSPPGYTKYPGEIDDSTTLPPTTDLITPVKAEVVNRLRAAILAIEAELGAQPSAAFGTVRTRLDAMRALINTLLSEMNKVKVSSTDTTSGFLEDKLAAGTNVSITKVGTGANEHLQINSSGGGGGGPHALTHEDGGSDEVTAQLLGSAGAVVDKVMVTDGAGGWTLEDYAAFVPHAATHEDGGIDEVTAQLLGSGGAGDGYVMVTDSGGWVLATTVPPDAHALTHEVGNSDELTAQDLGSATAADGYIMVADGLGGWRIELPSSGSKIVPGVSGYQDTQADSWEEVGGLIFNPIEFVGATFEFEALLQTTIIAKAANIRLYNITDGAEVTDSVLTSTSLTPELVSAVLTAPADLPNSEKIYAVQVKMSIAGGPNERCICKAAHIKVS